MPEYCTSKIRRFDIEDLKQYLTYLESRITHCDDCVYWNDGSCNCPNIVVNCQDYYVGDIQTNADDFCSYAERRDN